MSESFVPVFGSRLPAVVSFDATFDCADGVEGEDAADGVVDADAAGDDAGAAFADEDARLEADAS